MTIFVSFQKYNRAHDRMGRFTTTGGGGGSGSVQQENMLPMPAGFGDATMGQLLVEKHKQSGGEVSAAGMPIRRGNDAMTRVGVTEEAINHLPNVMASNTPESAVQAQAVFDYTGGFFQAINTQSATGAVALGTKETTINNTAKSLDEIIAGAPPLSATGITVFRGMRGKRNELQDLREALKNGETVTFKNFSSATTDLKVAQSASGMGRKIIGKPFVLKLTTKSGLVIGKNGSLPVENEILLKRGTTIRVDKITKLKENVVQLGASFYTNVTTTIVSATVID